MNKIVLVIKKYYQFFLPIMVILIAVGYLFYPQIQIIGMKHLADEKTGISFYYPKTWSILSDKDVKTYNPDALIGLIKTNSEDASFGIKIEDQSGKTNFKTKESLDGLKKILQNKLDDFSVLEEKERKFLGLSAVDITYNFSVPTDDRGGKFRGTQRQIIFLYKEKLYTLMFNSLPQDFRRDNKDFEKILETFKVK